MQDKVILGLLAYGGKSLYELKKIMEQSTSMFFSASTGSIHPALKKLQSAGLVVCNEEIQGKRAKKVYSRTTAGAEVFQAWIAEPVASMKVKDEGLLRLYFFGQIEQNVEPFIQRYIDETQLYIEALEPLYRFNKQQSVPAEVAKAAFFELATLKYGIDVLKFAKQWYQDLLDEYRESGIESL